MQLMKWIMMPLAVVAALMLGIGGFGLPSAAASGGDPIAIESFGELRAIAQGDDDDGDPDGLLRVLEFLINLDGNDQDGDGEVDDPDKDSADKDKSKDKSKDKKEDKKDKKDKDKDDRGDSGDDDNDGGLG